jgi:uncharacterized protein involved in exopolysaccharide biosynthesis
VQEEKRFVLYEYLVFFWNKKWLFLLLPLITIGLAFLISMMQPVHYQGRAILYTGDLKGSETDPQVIKHSLKDEAKGMNLSVEVFERGQLVFTVTGDNPSKVRKAINDINNKHFRVLKNVYESKIRKTKEEIKTKQKHIDTLNELTESYKKQDESGTLTDDEESRMSELQLASVEIEEQIDSKKKDVEFYEKPQKLQTSVTESSRNQKAYLALGLVAGLFLSLLTLILWKYIEEARRYRKND